MGSLRTYRWLFLTLGLAVVGTAVGAIALLFRTSPRTEVETRSGKRRWHVAAALGIALVASGLVGGAYAYDAAREQVLAPGVRVGHVELGGLSAQQAKRKLARAYRALRRPIVVRSEAERFRLTPRQARLRVRTDEALARALERSRRGSFLQRSVRALAGWEVGARLSPRVTYSRAAVARFAERVSAAVERPPRAAGVTPGSGGLVIRAAEDGFDVDTVGLRRRLDRALTSVRAPRTIRLPARRIRPEVTVADLRDRYPTYITVDRGSFRLRLYERLVLVRTYTIAVGAIGYDTPEGLYPIGNKAVNPSWTVPNSPWTGSLAGSVIPPGPSNPLKARWLGIYGGVGIHGTDQDWSLGSAASHGCLRMSIPDVIELYDRVDVGTPVYIG